jgi:O-antigen/teichoic acid export membrane protein
MDVSIKNKNNRTPFAYMNMDFLSGIKGDLKNIFRRLKTSDFSGNIGMAMRNSTYQFSTGIIAKIGSLIFTIILARLLMPELFGLYSLALSTILIFAAFSDLGIGETLVRFVSRELGKGNISKAEVYSRYLIKIKLFLTSFISLILILLSNFISDNYYHKPISLALLAGGIYVFIASFVVILQSILQAYNLFRPIIYKELLFQVVRIILVPVVILLSLKNLLNGETILFLIIIIFDFAYLLIAGLLYFFSRKHIFSAKFLSKNLSEKEKKKINKFIFITSFLVLSGVFFGYIDIIMLGYFVSSEYIGYYQGAFSFISAIIPLLTFSGALLPVFSRLNKKNARIIFEKTIKILSVVSIMVFLFVIFAAKYLILITFGSEYLASVNILRIFSLLFLSIPVITIYSTYFTSFGKPEIVSRYLVISTIVNIILNYLFISYLLNYSPLYAIYGAAIATVISRYIYMFLLMFYKRRTG